MGMDVYGLNPQLMGEKPIAPNWDTATKEEKDEYFKENDSFEENNPGYYFRANIWAWRPIHMICDVAIKVANLPLSTKGWGDNGGHGLKTQKECNLLAEAIDLFLILNQANAKDDDDRLYLCTGMWVHEDGTFISGKEDRKLNSDLAHLEGTVLYGGVVATNGELVFPAHAVSLGHVRRFIKFLRGCGGFEIC